jgi:hypothetical protein
MVKGTVVLKALAMLRKLYGMSAPLPREHVVPSPQVDKIT